jgi:hypothetical protein
LARSARAAQVSPYFPTRSPNLLRNGILSGSPSAWRKPQTTLDSKSRENAVAGEPLLPQSQLGDISEESASGLGVSATRRALASGSPDPQTKRANYGSFTDRTDPMSEFEPLSKLNIGDPALEVLDGASLVDNSAPGRPKDGDRDSPPRPPHVRRQSKVTFRDSPSEKIADRSTNESSFVSAQIHRVHKAISFATGSILKDKTSPAFKGKEPQLDTYRDFQTKNDVFVEWMQSELDKVETFYKLKENEATRYMVALREQLHEMRDRRLEQEHIGKKGSQTDGNTSGANDRFGHHIGSNWLHKVDGMRRHSSKPDVQALQSLGSPSIQMQEIVSDSENRPDDRDFVRKKPGNDISYTSARKKLKLALKEYYRGLELLKSYVLLNQKAFRKIQKKYDKAVFARPTQRFMTESVNKAWFVQSEVLDHHMTVVEDLYSRYFERGNHKLAVGKLRTSITKNDEWHASFYRGSLLIGAGLVFGIQGLVSARQRLLDTTLGTSTGYLLQVLLIIDLLRPITNNNKLYAGMFLPLALAFLLCVDCAIWTKEKINFVFIFEFDSRHHLDWRQLLEVCELSLQTPSFADSI